MQSGKCALTKGEYEKVITACGAYEDELLIKIGVSLGLRREDLVKIKIADINLDTGWLMYHEKKKNATRRVPLSSDLQQDIRKYLKTIPHKQVYLFNFSGSTAYRKFQRVCDCAKIPRRPIHALRATCVKFCQAAEWTPEQVSELTGDSIRVIQEHYSTPSDEEMKEVMEKKKVI
jgi:integrase